MDDYDFENPPPEFLDEDEGGNLLDTYRHLILAAIRDGKKGNDVKKIVPFLDLRLEPLSNEGRYHEVYVSEDRKWVVKISNAVNPELLYAVKFVLEEAKIVPEGFNFRKEITNLFFSSDGGAIILKSKKGHNIRVSKSKVVRMLDDITMRIRPTNFGGRDKFQYSTLMPPNGMEGRTTYCRMHYEHLRSFYNSRKRYGAIVPETHFMLGNIPAYGRSNVELQRYFSGKLIKDLSVNELADRTLQRQLRWFLKQTVKCLNEVGFMPDFNSGFGGNLNLKVKTTSPPVLCLFDTNAPLIVPHNIFRRFKKKKLKIIEPVGHTGRWNVNEQFISEVRGSDNFYARRPDEFLVTVESFNKFLDRIDEISQNQSRKNNYKPRRR
ncbi:hypothetical protein K9N08_04910 [Candidatus Gracilibacteria bacterium]|nr:hypothetical protein [Candidatus Gracilibacteria bacterium]